MNFFLLLTVLIASSLAATWQDVGDCKCRRNRRFMSVSGNTVVTIRCKCPHSDPPQDAMGVIETFSTNLLGIDLDTCTCPHNIKEKSHETMMTYMLICSCPGEIPQNFIPTKLPGCSQVVSTTPPTTEATTTENPCMISCIPDNTHTTLEYPVILEELDSIAFSCNNGYQFDALKWDFEAYCRNNTMVDLEPCYYATCPSDQIARYGAIVFREFNRADAEAECSSRNGTSLMSIDDVDEEFYTFFSDSLYYEEFWLLEGLFRLDTDRLRDVEEFGHEPGPVFCKC